jgi:hypothetical protein
MAIFEKSTKSDSDSYIALLDSEDELAGFITPVKNVPQKLLVEQLKAKGLNVEVRDPKSDRTTLTL